MFENVSEANEWDGEPTKSETKAAVAQLIVEDYTDNYWREEGTLGLEDDVVDVLTNFRHLCFSHGLDFERLVDESLMHFKAEVDDDREWVADSELHR